MIMILDDTNLSNAIARAKELHPTVKMIRFGVYSVTGSTAGTSYEVSCYRDPQGRKTVACTCKTRDGVCCKHVAASILLHCHVAAQRAIAAR